MIVKNDSEKTNDDIGCEHRKSRLLARKRFCNRAKTRRQFSAHQHRQPAFLSGRNFRTEHHRASQLIHILEPKQFTHLRAGQEDIIRQSRVTHRRLAAIYELQKLGEDASAACELLSRLITDQFESDQFQLEMIEVLSRMGAGATQALPALEELQRSPDHVVTTRVKFSEYSDSKHKRFLLILHAQPIDVVKTKITEIEKLGYD